MERHGLTAAGVCSILKNFFGRLSSNIRYFICKKCGGTCVHYDKTQRQYLCQSCGSLLDNEVISNGYSYNAILLNHIFFACGVS